MHEAAHVSRLAIERQLQLCFSAAAELSRIATKFLGLQQLYRSYNMYHHSCQGLSPPPLHLCVSYYLNKWSFGRNEVNRVSELGTA